MVWSSYFSVIKTQSCDLIFTSFDFHLEPLFNLMTEFEYLAVQFKQRSEFIIAFPLFTVSAWVIDVAESLSSIILALNSSDL